MRSKIYRIVYVVHLVEYDPFDILDIVAVVVEHLLQDLSRHHNAGRIRVQRDIARADADY